jgi:hypothetical protein
MSQDPNLQAFAKFADGAFRAQALALKGLEKIAGLQFEALERQAESAADFVAGALEARDAEALRVLWEKGASLGRENAERGVAVGQEIFAVAQQAVESLGAIVNESQQAANDAAAAPSGRAKKAATR